MFNQIFTICYCIFFALVMLRVFFKCDATRAKVEEELTKREYLRGVARKSGCIWRPSAFTSR